MGQSINRRIIILVAMLAVVGLFRGFKTQTVASSKAHRLSEALSQISGWEKAKLNPLEPNILDALELDDYIFATYRRNNHNVNLYIGYYNSPEKIGAAHDPLVCFPGQGWSITNRAKGQFFVKYKDVNSNINYSSFMATKAAQNEFVVYWFQVNDKTSSNTFQQKMNLLSTKITKKTGENAFVRISCSVENESVEVVYKEIRDFATSFYPTFLKYVNNS